MKLSIVMPVFNVAPYLTKSLGSVLAQTERDWECICVDDGSTDGSAKVLAEFAARDSRIRILTQANAGVSAARNAGLAVAQGDWIHFLDSDDYLAPNFYELIFSRVAEEPDAEVVVTAMKSLYVDGSSRIANDMLGVGTIRGDVLAQIYRTNRYGIAFCMADKACRRQLFSDNGICFLVGLQTGEDSLCCQTVLAHAHCVVVDGDNNGYCYWHHQGSLTVSVTLDKVKHQIDAAVASIALWRATQIHGTYLFAYSNAIATLFLADRYSAVEQNEYLTFLVSSRLFNRSIVPFIILHGSPKSRLVGILLLMTPGPFRMKALQLFRKMRHG